MRKFVGLTLVAACLGSVLAISGASAQPPPPVIGRCGKVLTTGKGLFHNSRCTEEGGSKEYVWVVILGPSNQVWECGITRKANEASYKDELCTEESAPFQYQKVLKAARGNRGAGGPTAFESNVGESVTCTKDTSTGEITGEATIGSLRVTYNGCTGKSGGTVCSVKSVGAKNGGEILTTTLKGELGLVATSEATSGVGLLIAPLSGAEFAQLQGSCIVEGDLEGSVAGEIAPVNSLQGTSKLTFLASSTAKQKIARITVKGTSKRPELLDFGLVNVSEEASEVLTFEEAVEIT
jgi:hypothetical protein